VAGIGFIFWDAIPVSVVHRRLCEKDAGFVVFKTVEQWQLENPGVAETLVRDDSLDSIQLGSRTRYLQNQRFAFDTEEKEVWHLLSQNLDQIVDMQTGEVLAQYIDYHTNLGNVVAGPRKSAHDFKIWIDISTCETPDKNGSKPKVIQFNGFKQAIQSLGGEK
jgi:hypothetical protein